MSMYNRKATGTKHSKKVPIPAGRQIGYEEFVTQFDILKDRNAFNNLHFNNI